MIVELQNFEEKNILSYLDVMIELQNYEENNFILSIYIIMCILNRREPGESRGDTFKNTEECGIS